MYRLQLCCPKCGEPVYEQIALTQEQAEQMARKACDELLRVIARHGWDEWRDGINVTVGKESLQ